MPVAVTTTEAIRKAGMTRASSRHQERDFTSPDWQDRLAGTNINPDTLLATDYLNHFNEVVMLLEMLPSMPECLDEILAWKPKSYPQHFADSGFAARHLAIEAYSHAPEQVRAMLEAVVGHMDRALTEMIDRLRHESDQAKAEAPAAARQLHQLIDLAGSVINGSAAPDALDRLNGDVSGKGEEHFTQDDIDSLFD